MNQAPTTLRFLTRSGRIAGWGFLAILSALGLLVLGLQFDGPERPALFASAAAAFLIGVFWCVGLTRVELDTDAGELRQAIGLPLPLLRFSRRLEALACVEVLSQSNGGKRPNMSFPVVLQFEEAVQLARCADFEAARAIAERVAKALNRPLKDSAGHSLFVRDADKLDESLGERLRRMGVPDVPAARPENKIRMRAGEGATVFETPERTADGGTWGLLGCLVFIAGWLAATLFVLSTAFKAPASALQAGSIVLFAAVLLLLRAVFRNAHKAEKITLSADALTIETRSYKTVRTRSMPLSELEELHAMGYAGRLHHSNLIARSDRESIVFGSLVPPEDRQWLHETLLILIACPDRALKLAQRHEMETTETAAQRAIRKDAVPKAPQAIPAARVEITATPDEVRFRFPPVGWSPDSAGVIAFFALLWPLLATFLIPLSKSEHDTRAFFALLALPCGSLCALAAYLGWSYARLWHTVALSGSRLAVERHSVWGRSSAEFELNRIRDLRAAPYSPPALIVLAGKPVEICRGLPEAAWLRDALLILLTLDPRDGKRDELLRGIVQAPVPPPEERPAGVRGWRECMALGAGIFSAAALFMAAVGLLLAFAFEPGPSAAGLGVEAPAAGETPPPGLLSRAPEVLQLFAVRLPLLAAFGALCGLLRYLRWASASREGNDGCFVVLMMLSIGLIQLPLLFFMAALLYFLLECAFKVKAWREGTSAWCVGGALVGAILFALSYASRPAPLAEVVLLALVVSIWPADYLVSHRVRVWHEKRLLA